MLCCRASTCTHAFCEWTLHLNGTPDPVPFVRQAALRQSVQRRFVACLLNAIVHHLVKPGSERRHTGMDGERYCISVAPRGRTREDLDLVHFL